MAELSREAMRTCLFALQLAADSLELIELKSSQKLSL